MRIVPVSTYTGRTQRNKDKLAEAISRFSKHTKSKEKGIVFQEAFRYSIGMKPSIVPSVTAHGDPPSVKESFNILIDRRTKCSSLTKL